MMFYHTLFFWNEIDKEHVINILMHSFTGVPKFILISVHDYNLPSFLLTSGYFTGKRKAESEVLSKYPASG
jgi:fucose 4-O-acetylase-like acetyltransferase